eukprot:TRINITY_DN14545_c0_g1_i1.p1 TRINITY_DN14545_c0_g1~~TRINITY_DN14545_c0_g1_i1.p1  ORF type:complete len:632 (+),score=85.58 TRINITY_DN14545_c0_g1_i1:182-1897(+)
MPSVCTGGYSEIWFAEAALFCFCRLLAIVEKLSIGRSFASTGFMASYASLLFGIVPLLPMSLWAVWSVANIGPVRKSLTTSVIAVFGVPAYVVLSGVLLAILWILVSSITYVMAILTPVLGFVLIVSIGRMTRDFVRYQERQRPEVVHDIEVKELVYGVLSGIACLFIFGIPGAILSLAKIPCVVISCTAQAILTTVGFIGFCGPFCCPVIFVLWSVACLVGIIVLALFLAVLVVIETVATAVWPAYVASGMLMHVANGGRRLDSSFKTAMRQGFLAGYQLFWFSDVAFNALIVGRPKLAMRAHSEFVQVVTGRRSQLSRECQAISCFPTASIELSLDEWDFAARLVADDLGTSTEVVAEGWRALKDEMVLHGSQALQAGLLTEDYIASVPPELVIGLPARALLDVIERSPPGEIVLSSSLSVQERTRPRGEFADRAWNELQRAQAALRQLKLGRHERDRLAATLLAGGGDYQELPRQLAELTEEFESLPEEEREAYRAVQQPLIGLAVECSRQPMFRSKLHEVLQALADPEDGMGLFGLDRRPSSDSWIDDSVTTTSGEIEMGENPARFL